MADISCLAMPRIDFYLIRQNEQPFLYGMNKRTHAARRQVRTSDRLLEQRVAAD